MAPLRTRTTSANRPLPTTASVASMNPDVVIMSLRRSARRCREQARKLERIGSHGAAVTLWDRAAQADARADALTTRVDAMRLMGLDPRSPEDCLRYARGI